MREEHFQVSLAALAWSETSNPSWPGEALDERGIHSLLHSVVLRNLGKFTEARQILQRGILSQDRNTFRGHMKDDWIFPSAHYEMAAICWRERKGSGREQELISECGEWLDKAATSDSYEMDARYVHLAICLFALGSPMTGTCDGLELTRNLALG